MTRVAPLSFSFFLFLAFLSRPRFFVREILLRNRRRPSPPMDAVATLSDAKCNVIMRIRLIRPHRGRTLILRDYRVFALAIDVTHAMHYLLPLNNIQLSHVNWYLRPRASERVNERAILLRDREVVLRRNKENLSENGDNGDRER